MKREEFITQFAIQFLAAYAAKEYTHICMTGDHKRFDHMPVEDAYHLADKAWVQSVLLGYEGSLEDKDNIQNYGKQ